MATIGYIAGSCLQDLEDQWCELLELSPDKILFDRTFWRPYSRINLFSESSRVPPEILEMRQYVETMLGAQGQLAAAREAGSGYSSLAELEKDDYLFFTSLDVLQHASEDICSDLLDLHEDGVFIGLIDCGFLSSAAYSAIHMAAILGSVRDLDALIEAGADVNLCTDDAKAASPLYWAHCLRHRVIAKRLIAAGADVNQCAGDGASCLHEASRTGDSEMVRALLAQGADVDAVKDDGSTPICSAVLRGHLEVAKILLHSGANPDVAGIGMGEAAGPDYRATPLFIAAQEENSQLALLLLEYGADPEHPNAVGPGGHTPLHKAARAVDLALAKALLDAGASKTTRASDGTIPLNWAGPNDDRMRQLLSA